jgi:hypothetical protein
MTSRVCCTAWVLSGLLGAAVPVAAQAPITATPLPPPTGFGSQTQPQTSAPAQSRPAAATAAWTPRGGAVIQALDKVNARSKQLTIKPGESVAFETLTIAVRTCVVRPPDQPPDAAAFLTVTDSLPGTSGFSGWMLQSAPAASMLEHPLYDLRVMGCAGG